MSAIGTNQTFLNVAHMSVNGVEADVICSTWVLPLLTHFRHRQSSPTANQVAKIAALPAD
jgi:hypothetical protein